MVQWPGRRGKMLKWRTPFGKWASYAIYGSYAFIGWNLIPIAVYYMRKRTYEEEYRAGKHSRHFDQLSSSEQYFAFYGWDIKSTKKIKLDIANWTVEELDESVGGFEQKLLHDLPPEVVAERDYQYRQEKLEQLRLSVSKAPPQENNAPGHTFFFPTNAIFEA